MASLFARLAARISSAVPASTASSRVRSVRAILPMARIVEAGIGQWSGESDADDKTLIVRGQANLIENATAAADLERIRKLFEDIENKKELAQLLGAAEQGEGVRIFIGSENRLFSLSGSSIIVTPFRNAEEKIVGVMGIIGPTRMNYARIIPMVDYTAKAIGRLLT